MSSYIRMDVYIYTRGSLTQWLIGTQLYRYIYIYIETTQLPVIHSSTNNYINVIKYLMLQHIRLPALIKDWRRYITNQQNNIN